jgi:hypothetical protein
MRLSWTIAAVADLREIRAYVGSWVVFRLFGLVCQWVAYFRRADLAVAYFEQRGGRLGLAARRGGRF